MNQFLMSRNRIFQVKFVPQFFGEVQLVNDDNIGHEHLPIGKSSDADRKTQQLVICQLSHELKRSMIFIARLYFPLTDQADSLLKICFKACFVKTES